MKITSKREITEIPHNKPKIVQVTNFAEFIPLVAEGRIQLSCQVGYLSDGELSHEYTGYQLDKLEPYFVEFSDGTFAVSDSESIVSYAEEQGQRALDFI